MFIKFSTEHCETENALTATVVALLYSRGQQSITASISKGKHKGKAVAANFSKTELLIT